MATQTLPVEEALERLEVIPDYDPGSGPGPCVHTFAQAAFGLLGAHWYLSDVRRSFERWGVEESGEQAQAMNHGLVVIERAVEGSPFVVFFATKEEQS